MPSEIPESVLPYSLLCDMPELPTEEPLEYLSLFLTCRQLSEECRKLLCEKNTFCGWPSLTRLRNGETSALRDIQRIIFVCFPNVIGYLSSPLKTALSNCQGWSRIKTLRHITLFIPLCDSVDYVSYRQCLTENESQNGFNFWASLWALDPIFYENIDFDYCKSVLEYMENLKISLSQSHIKFDIRVERARRRNDPNARTQDTNATVNLMRELHESIGAELWANEILCYKDGVEIAEPFEGQIPSSDQGDRYYIDFQDVELEWI